MKKQRHRIVIYNALDGNNLSGWAVSQKLFVDNFEREKNASNFDEKFI